MSILICVEREEILQLIDRLELLLPDYELTIQQRASLEDTIGDCADRFADEVADPAAGGRGMKRSPKPLAGQLALFPPDLLPPPPDHDPSDMTWAEVAQWTLENGTGILSAADNAFLFAFVRRGGRLSQKNQDRLSELHRCVGGRELPSWLPWERNPRPRRRWK